MDDKLKRTLKSMIIGTSIYNFVLLILSTIFFIIYYKNKNVSDFHILIIKNELSLIIGYIVSIFGLYSMAKSLEKAVMSKDEKYAKKHMTLMSTIRFIIFCIILVIIINKKVFGITGGIMYALAAFGLKVGAYLSPIIEKKL